MLNVLKKDMDGFAAFELPHLENRSDPAVNLPLTRFQGDYQRVKDELLVISRTPDLQSQLSIDDVDGIGANLRFLHRTYRIYATNQMVPPPKTGLAEGFEDANASDADSSQQPITPDQLSMLSQKLSVEIIRLQASGTTDPVVEARVNVFTKMQQTISDLNNRVKAGTMDPKDIPIKFIDYQNFLPALGDSSAGIGGLLSKAGLGSVSSLFNSYEAGDISGSALAASLIDKYAEDLMKGLSYSISYTSANEVAKLQALGQAKANANAKEGFEFGFGSLLGLGGVPRGEFDEKIISMSKPRKSSEAAHFDWKERAAAIEENIKKAGLNPGDFGSLPKGAQVSSDYSWRGHTKMMCSRLATHIDTGFPEQMGCPPVSWKGWRL
jgi:hypothetical protein